MGQTQTHREKRRGNTSERKLIGGLIILAFSAVLFIVFLRFINEQVNTINDQEAQAALANVMHNAVEKQLTMFQAVSDEIEKKHLTDVKLTALAAGAMLQKQPEKLPCMTSRGAIIGISGGTCLLPEGFPEHVRVNAEEMTADAGMLFSVDPPGMEPFEDGGPVPGKNETGLSEPDNESTGDYYVFYSKIGDRAAYIEWVSYDEFLDSLSRLFQLDENVSSVEKALNVKSMLFAAEPVDGGRTVIYRSGNLPAFLTAEEYGFTDEMLTHVLPAEKEPTREEIRKNFRKLSIADVSYGVFMQEYESSILSSRAILALLVPLDDTLGIMNERAYIVMTAFVLIGIFITVWHVLTRYLVRKHTLNERQRAELGPRTVIRRTGSFVVVGFALILIITALMVSLFRLYLTSRQVDNAFAILRHRIEDEKSQSELMESFHKNNYEGYVRRIAEILNDYPELATAGDLAAMSSTIGANYLMLFDENGDEILSNSRYDSLSLGRGPSSATAEFRILLTGTELIFHDLAVDETTGEANVLIGASYGRSGERGKYKAVLAAVPGEKIYYQTDEEINSILSSLVEKDMTAYSVDPETRLILHASDEQLIGKNAVDMGLPEQALTDGYRDFFTMGGVSWFGECEKMGAELYMYAAKQSSIFVRVAEQSLLAAGAALLLLSILGVYLCSGYRAFFTKWAKTGEIMTDQTDEVMLSGGRLKFSIDPSRRWRLNSYDVGIQMPFMIAKLVMELFFIVFLIVMGVRLMISSGDDGTSLLSYIMNGRWSKGVNLFAFTSILILFGEITVISEVIRLLLYLISGALGTRGETVCRLLSNLVRYVGVIAFVYFALYDLGFRPDALLASLGLLSFAISLGAKDLIADIIAGLSIVFEGTYQVGDIIDVGGYRGEVLEIGVRSTKIEGRGGNIKIIDNQDIKNVINLTRKTSWCALEISIPSSQPLHEVEAMLREQLPQIGKANQEVISGPFYKGIIALGRGSVTLSIIAECNEADIHSVQRWMYHTIQDLFSEKGIPLA